MATIQDIFDWLNQGAQGDIPGTGGEQPNAGAASQPQMAGDVIAPEFRQGMPQNDQSQLNDQWPGGGPFNWGALPLGPHLVTPQQPTPVPRSPGTPANEASAEPSAQEAAERRRRQGYLAGQKAGQGLFGKPQQQPKTVTVDPDTMSNLDFSGIGNLLSQYHQIAQTAPGTNLYFDAPQTSVSTPADYSGDIPAELLPHYQTLLQQGIPPDVAKSILLQPSTGEGESPTQAGYPLWPYAYGGEQQEFLARLGQQPRDKALDQHMWDQRFYAEMNQPTQEGQVQGPGDNFGFLRLPSGQYVPPGWGGQ